MGKYHNSISCEIQYVYNNRSTELGSEELGGFATDELLDLW